MGEITPRSLVRALDVGGGDGRLSKSFLVNSYNIVDLFDQCPIAVEKAKKALRNNLRFGYAEQASMEHFQWRFHYSAIFMVWTAGYLPEEKLGNFLRIAKTRLLNDEGRFTRRTEPKSFIIVLDNVLPDGWVAPMDKGQRFRTQKQLETIFDQAGLRIHR